MQYYGGQGRRSKGRNAPVQSQLGCAKEFIKEGEKKKATGGTGKRKTRKWREGKEEETK